MAGLQLHGTTHVAERSPHAAAEEGAPGRHSVPSLNPLSVRLPRRSFPGRPPRADVNACRPLCSRHVRRRGERPRAGTTPRLNGRLGTDPAAVRR